MGTRVIREVATHPDAQLRERNEDIEGVVADAVRAVTEDRIPAVVHVVADPAKLLPGM